MAPPTRPPTWKQWKVAGKKKLRNWSQRWVWISWPEWAMRRVASFVRSYVPGLSRLVLFAVAGCSAWLLINDVADRDRIARFQAWQVIHAAHGQRVSGARIKAMQYLNEIGESFGGVDLHGVDLSGISLPDARLGGANLEDTNLSSANLRGANLYGANLRRSRLIGVDLSDARLERAVLRGANLMNARLCRVDLQFADLRGTDFLFANLNQALLNRANLQGADLRFAILDDLRVWWGIKSIRNANIFGVSNPPARFLDWAQHNGAVIFDGERWCSLRDSVLKSRK
jgi:uncharacterized protein YjbI with pentapeptide repeats